MRNLFLPIGFALLLLGAGCSNASPATDVSLDLSYTLPADGSVTITKSTIDASEVVKADALFAQATECGYARAVEYYLDIENLFVNKKAEQYVFMSVGDYSAPKTWTVTVLPNTPLYGSTDSFKTDFDICAVGGDMYPFQSGANTLVFTNSCGSGDMNDGEIKESGCDVARNAIEATITAK